MSKRGLHGREKGIDAIYNDFRAALPRPIRHRINILLSKKVF